MLVLMGSSFNLELNSPGYFCSVGSLRDNCEPSHGKLKRASRKEWQKSIGNDAESAKWIQAGRRKEGWNYRPGVRRELDKATKKSEVTWEAAWPCPARAARGE